MNGKGAKKRKIGRLLAVTLAAALFGACLSPMACPMAYAASDDGLNEDVQELLTVGEYEEGQALVLYDRLADRSDGEQVVGAAGEPSLISDASVINTVSAESFYAATGETLPEAGKGETTLGSSGNGKTSGTEAEDEEDRLAILLIEDADKNTEDLLGEVIKESGVLYAQPNYIHRIDEADENHSETVQNIGRGQDDSRTNISLAKDKNTSETKDIDGDGSISGINDVFEDESPLGNGSSDPEDGAAEPPLITDDYTIWQWPEAGQALGPVTEHDPSEIYNVHAPKWNTEGEANADGVIAILDSGIDYNHPDLKDVMYTFTPEMQEELGCGPYGINVTGEGEMTDPMDDNSHGTHCAGIIAGAWDGRGISGMASGCHLLAVKIADRQGIITDLAKLRGMAFVQMAVDKGVDIKVTNNSYSGVIQNPLFSVEIAELEKKGIVCAYSSGNDSVQHDVSNKSGNQLRASNAVIVNAATAMCEKADFSDYGEGMTDVYAPGAGIFSSVSNGASDAKKTYLGAADPSALYYDTQFDSLPDIYYNPDDYPLKLNAVQAVDTFSYDGDGRSLGISVVEADDEIQAFEFSVDIPMGAEEAVPYASMALYAPGGEYAFKIYRKLKNAEGEVVVEESPDVTVDGNWVLLSCSGAPDMVFGQGCTFLLDRTEDGSGFVTTVYVNVYKTRGSIVAGDCIYLDAIGTGTNAAALIPYAYFDGSSMAVPHVAAEAAILYAGLERSEANAAEIARQIRSKVVQKDSLWKCTSHGAIDLAVREEEASPIVDGANVDKEAGTLAVTGCYFRTSGKVFLAEEEMEVLIWEDGKIIARLPDSMKSGVQIVRVQTEAGNGSGSFLLYAPNELSDSATPLYETEIPKIPEDIFAEGSLVKGMVGLNDCLYLLIAEAEEDNLTFLRTTGMLCYSMNDKAWRKVSDFPGKLTEVSIAAYRGKVIISGIRLAEDGGYLSLFSYSPRTGEWKNLNWFLSRNCALANLNGNLYALGGFRLDEKTEEVDVVKDIFLLDLENRRQYSVGELALGLHGFYAASDGNAIYASGGTKIQANKPEDSKQYLQKVTFATPSEGIAEELSPYESYQATDPYPANEVIAGYQGVYLVGYTGAQNFGEGEDPGVGTYVDPEGTEVLDADTFVLSGNEYVPYGKRLSHDIANLTMAAEYKGELYAFAYGVHEGDAYLNFFGRSTKVGEANAPAWDTFAIAVPDAEEGLVYNGEEQAGVPASSEGYYTIEGNVATEPGTYTATLTLTDPDWCVWEDGTDAPKTVIWTIAEAPEITEEPEITEKPEATVRPDVTARPDVSGKPSVTVKPDTTAKPDVTTKPEPTANPVVTLGAKTTVVAKSNSAAANAKVTTAAEKASSTSVKTGDESEPLAWIAVFVAAAAIIVVVRRRGMG
ncbi:MAG: S8 family serine peptidase [Lachnospiraceae bacterium]|nr:S8 family serine peptidase [Lachnospiraceae bacterium]